MFNSLSKINNDVNPVNKKKKSSINIKYNSQNSKTSVSSGLIKYLKTIENDGISLYTHVRSLLDVFIFQNPVQPIQYFEYYSKQLKRYYHESRPDSDLNFFNNIEWNICNKITNLYKNALIKHKEDKYLEDKISHYSFEEGILEYEGENNYEDSPKNTVELNEIIVQDISTVNNMFNKAGCGITNDEANLISIVINEMSYFGKFKNIRYWGKILGLKRNYYVLECEWQNKEIEYKFRLLNETNNDSKYVVDDYENIQENEAGEEEILSMGPTEQIEEERPHFSKSASVFSNPHRDLNKVTNGKSVYEPSIDSQKSKPLCFYSPIEELKTDDSLAHEMLGFGANKKTYFVTNQLTDVWVELPLLKPHHIVQSRNIKRYFVGDLESYVESYPPFHGLEKHYLRAQIARITAATQVSPRQYFVYSNNNVKSNTQKNFKSFQSKVMSLKWVHEYILNQNYNPPSVYDLLKPINWVHHIPLITNEGITRAWSRLRVSENYKTKDFDSGKNVQLNNLVTQETVTQLSNFNENPDIFVTLSDDVYTFGVPPWKFEMTNPFDHKATYVTIKSNFWPGAFAVTHKNLLDYTYYGWGQKWNVNSFTHLVPHIYQSEYPNDAKETTEIVDPTHADELSFLAKVEKMKEERKNMKIHKWFNPNGEEEEERIIGIYSYN